MAPIVIVDSTSSLKPMQRVVCHAMLSATDFRNFATTCTQIAGVTDAEAKKSELLSMAEKWNNLAEQADRIRRLVRDADAVLDSSNPDIEKQRIRRRFG
jgi:hypothetical protein